MGLIPSSYMALVSISHPSTLTLFLNFLSSSLIYRAWDLESGWFGLEFQLYHFQLCNSYLTSLEPQSSCM